MRASKVRTQLNRFLQNRTRAIHIAFLDGGATNVDPAVRILRINFRDSLESDFCAFQIALQQQANAVVIPALPVFGTQLSLWLKCGSPVPGDIQSDFAL